MKRLIVVVCLGVDFARAAVFGVGRLVATYDGASCSLQMVPVVVAAKDIPAGALIDSTAVYVALWPRGAEPAIAYASVGSVVGTISARRFSPGHAIVPDRPTPSVTEPPTGQRPATPGLAAPETRPRETRSGRALRPRTDAAR